MSFPFYFYVTWRMRCCRSDWPGFVCFAVINLLVWQATELILGFFFFCFINFPLLPLPSPYRSWKRREIHTIWHDSRVRKPVRARFRAPENHFRFVAINPYCRFVHDITKAAWAEYEVNGDLGVTIWALGFFFFFFGVFNPYALQKSWLWVILKSW